MVTAYDLCDSANSEQFHAGRFMGKAVLPEQGPPRGYRRELPSLEAHCDLGINGACSPRPVPCVIRSFTAIAHNGRLPGWNPRGTVR
jgi:hypothetical protein